MYYWPTADQWEADDREWKWRDDKGVRTPELWYEASSALYTEEKNQWKTNCNFMFLKYSTFTILLYLT